MKLRLRDYLKAAFTAKPIGMFVSPNVAGMVAFGLLGLFVNPGFWLLGAGLEFGYLYSMISNRRFRRLVEGKKLSEARKQWVAQRRVLVHRLDRYDRDRYENLEQRCRTILKQQTWGPAGSQLIAQGEGLDRLLWIYLRLLLTRQSLQRLLSDSTMTDGEGLTVADRIERVQHRLDDQELSDQLRRSLTGQLEILQQRQVKRTEAEQKLVFLEAELTRIQEQVELIREQAAVTTDPQTVSERIDAISATLGGTTQWIQEQQQMLGQVEDLLEEPPPVLLEAISE